MFVHEVIAAMTTEPYESEYSTPSNVNVEATYLFSSGMLYPLKPTGLARQAWKSFFI